MFVFEHFLKSLLGIVAYRAADGSIKLIDKLARDFTDGLNLYRCQICYRLYKNMPLECKCGNPKLRRIQRKTNDRYTEVSADSKKRFRSNH